MCLLQKHLNVRTKIVAIPFDVWMSGQEGNSSKAEDLQEHQTGKVVGIGVINASPIAQNFSVMAPKPKAY